MKKILVVLSVLIILSMLLSAWASRELPKTDPTVVSINPNNLPEGTMTLEQLLENVIGESQAVSFKLIEYDAETKTMQVEVDGRPITLVEADTDSYYFPGPDKLTFVSLDDGILEFWLKYDLFSDEAVMEMEHTGKNNLVALSGGDAWRRNLVLIPAEIMPKVVTDISSWDMTEAVLHQWPISGGGYGQVLENVTTNEVYINSPFTYVFTFDYQHNERMLDGWLWGFVHVEFDDHGNPTVYMTPTKPDLSMFQEAVTLQEKYWPEHEKPLDYDGLGQVCRSLSSEIYYGNGSREEVMAVCGAYFADYPKE